MVFLFGNGCPFSTFLFLILFHCLDEGKLSVAFFQIRFELNCSQIKFFSLCVFATIVQNVCQTDDNSAIIFIFSQTMTIPTFCFLVIFQLSEADAQDIIRFQWFFCRLVVPSNQIQLACTCSVFYATEAVDFKVDSWCSFQDILTELDNFFQFSLIEKLSTSCLSCQSGNPFDVYLMFFCCSIMLYFSCCMFLGQILISPLQGEILLYEPFIFGPLLCYICTKFLCIFLNRTRMLLRGAIFTPEVDCTFQDLFKEVKLLGFTLADGETALETENLSSLLILIEEASVKAMQTAAVAARANNQGKTI